MAHHLHSKRHWGMKVVMFLVIGVAAAFLFTFITMSLWNLLMPELFGLKVLSFWQTLGLLVLSWLFFGRFRGHGHRWKHRIAERWMRMSPEQREEFRRHLHGGWHHDRRDDRQDTPGDAK
ncbi:MAG TPA: hypothetical protein VLV87_06200 [Gammaproteobacteria bacterium]|nr:hypothetical protein [Gammaproteobacteria bacterium]